MIDPEATFQIAASNKPESEPGTDRLRVLLVDHNAFARSVGRQALRSVGIRSILEATSGREAIEFLGRSVLALDIVVCD
jgi:CheY-like chemotaxis protein